jgi:transcriptional regulator with XRE-family HTH domain
MDFQRTRDPHEANIQHLRDTASARVEGTSLRRVAREIGMSPTGLKKFLQGTAPYSPTVRRLRNWYVQYAAKLDHVVERHVASAALSVLVHDLPQASRGQTAACVLDCVGRGFVDRGLSQPGWVNELRQEYGPEHLA